MRRNTYYALETKNLARRHLNDDQRAAVAAEIANMQRGGDGSNQHKSKSAILRNSVSQPQAAKMMNVAQRPRGLLSHAAFKNDAKNDNASSDNSSLHLVVKIYFALRRASSIVRAS